MSRKKLLIENFLIYGVGSTAGKIIPIIFLPIVTRLIPNTSIYGIYDLFKTLGLFSIAFIGLGINNAMFRFNFEKESDDEYILKVCSTSLIIVLFSGLIFLLFILLFSSLLSPVLFNTNNDVMLVNILGIYVLFNVVSNIIVKPFQILNQRKKVVLLSWLTPLITYSASILMIKVWSPLPALIFGITIAPILTSLIGYSYNKHFFKLSQIDFKLIVPLLKFGLPLVPIFLIYGVFHSMDRIMISKFLGAGYLGLYAIGAKLGLISSLISTAFMKGYQHFLFSTMHYEDRVEKNSMIVDFFVVVIFLAFVIINPLIKPLFSIIFAKEYLEGYVVASYLFLGPLFMTIYQLSASQNQIDKKSYIITLLLLPGLIINIILNWFLIPVLGIEGAAIGTLSGYFLSMVMSLLITSKRKLIIVDKKTILTLSILSVFIAINYFIKDSVISQTILSLIGCGLLAVIYNSEIKKKVGFLK